MNILERYFKSLLYIQISPQRITLRNPVSGKVISEEPRIAISGAPKPKVLAVGAQAGLAISEPGSRIINPFAHSRTMISEFTIAESLLKEYVRRMFGSFRMAPTLILHLKGDPEGGFTQVERRAFRELGFGAGAARVTIYIGPDLSDEQLVAGDFSDSDG
jgi:rod shape-determining protein MreB and related proteins